MPCNLTLTLRYDTKIVVTTPDEDSNELAQILIAKVTPVQRGVYIWEKFHKIKKKTELKQVMDICKHYVQNEETPIGILFDGSIQTYTPSVGASGICFAGKNPSDQPIQLNTEEIGKMVEFEEKMTEAFEIGLNTNDCECFVESAFFLIECGTGP